jgi:hypothetical protein
MIQSNYRENKINREPLGGPNEMTYVNFRLIETGSMHSLTKGGEFFRASPEIRGIYIYKN